MLRWQHGRLWLNTTTGPQLPPYEGLLTSLCANPQIAAPHRDCLPNHSLFPAPAYHHGRGRAIKLPQRHEQRGRYVRSANASL